jgi:RNA polymerase sigma-70 factor (ECF subfamily)
MPTQDRLWRERGLRDAVLAGDERAWQTWYEESFAGLYAYVHWRCGGLREAAEDIVQQTWLTAVRRIRRFQPEQGCFSSWLRGIAANLLRKHFYRDRTRSFQASSQTDCPAPEDRSLEVREQAEAIARALAALPERYEAVLRAKYFDQQSVEEIASLWNETPKAVESLLSRARQAFREVYPYPNEPNVCIREMKP